MTAAHGSKRHGTASRVVGRVQPPVFLFKMLDGSVVADRPER
jgi:hypothetical protein